MRLDQQRKAVRAKRRLLAFQRDARGVTAVEFALIAPFFFMLIFSVMEVALISFATSTFRTGLSYATRLIRTGDAQCFSEKQFIKALCSKAGFAPSCETRTTVERKVFPVGYTTDLSLAVSAKEFKSLSGGDVVMVSATYKWPLQSPIVEPFLGDGGGAFSFQLSFLFKNELFASKSCS
ncbi:MAG: pilus assembly protein [Neomegalonema sp.]|nr:pilus assembly protein [Neomegalonema sp.]